MTRLPAPEQWVIHTMDEKEVGEMLERHIEFFDWKGRAVHCPTPFVGHYMRRAHADFAGPAGFTPCLTARNGRLIP